MAYAGLDTIYLRNLQISAIIGPDAWGRKDKVQPVILNIRLKIDTTRASGSDDIKDTFSYGQMCKEVTSGLYGKTFNNLQHLITALTTFAAFWPGEDTKLQALAPKALLRAEGGLEITHSIRKKERYEENGVPQVRHVDTRSWSIKGLKVPCIIGVNEHEREEKQSVVIDLRIPAIDPKTFEAKDGPGENWRSLVKRTCAVVEESSFETVEALAALIATTALEEFPIQEITVAIEKPCALTFVEGAGVEITRRRANYTGLDRQSSSRSEVSRPRMTLDQYRKSNVDQISPAPSKIQPPPMHQAPTLAQYHDMKRRSEGPEKFADLNGSLTSPRATPLPQSPKTPNASRTLSPGPRGTQPTITQPVDSSSYYIDGSFDSTPQASVKSHDFATGKKHTEIHHSPSSSSTPSKPEPSFYPEGNQFEYGKSAAPFRLSDLQKTDNNISRISDSSSMFGAAPSSSLLDDIQAPFSADGEGDGVRPVNGTGGRHSISPGLSSLNLTNSNEDDESYFDKSGNLKQEYVSPDKDIKFGEAF